MKFSIILAHELNNGIGLENKLPWYYKEDLKFFKETTKNSIVIMGKNTFDHLPIKPLPDRINIVLSRNINSRKDNLIYTDIKNLQDEIFNISNNYKKEIFIIGGKEIYDLFYNKTLSYDLDFYVDKIYISKIKNHHKSDTFINLPFLSIYFNESHKKETKDIDFCLYKLIE